VRRWPGPIATLLKCGTDQHPEAVAARSHVRTITGWVLLRKNRTVVRALLFICDDTDSADHGSESVERQIEQSHPRSIGDCPPMVRVRRSDETHLSVLQK
jgi:hypothetical protein